MQQYIKLNKKWYIPGSIFLNYNFGHHDAYLFPEQKLGNEYTVDYMLVGKSSDGYSVVLVEFEKADTPYCRSTDNMESESVSRRDFMDEKELEVRSQTMYDLHNVKIVTFDRWEDNIRKLKLYNS